MQHIPYTNLDEVERGRQEMEAFKKERTMTLSEAWKPNGAASYQYGNQTITVVCVGEDALDVRIGDGPVCRLNGADFGDLLYLLSISPEEGWQSCSTQS